MGYPKLKLYAPKDLGHQFMLSPVDEALSWLDAMVGDDTEHCMKCAEEWAKAGNWADAVPAALRAQEIKAATGPQKNRAKALLANAEKAAKPAVDAMQKSMMSEPGATWVLKWYEFRRGFGSTKAAEPLIKTYESMRKSQKTRGELLFETALDYGRSGKKDLQKASLLELLEKAPATYHAWYAMSWLKDWKD